MSEEMYGLLYLVEIFADIAFKVMILILISKCIGRNYGRIERKRLSNQ